MTGVQTCAFRSIVEGTVEEIRNVKIRFGAEKCYGAIITIKPEEIIKGTLDETQIKIFVDCNIGKADSSGDSEILKTLKEKDRGIFIIYKYSDTDVWENDKKNLYMDELAEYGFEDAERFAFIEKNGKVYFSSIYKNISEDDTLEEIKEYIKQKRKELL